MVTVDIPPGVAYNASRKRNTANWREVNMMRWDRLTMRPIGGWEEQVVTTFASRLRAIHKWVANNGDVYVAYLCEAHCYVDNGTTVVDVSPTIVPIVPPLTGDFAYGGYGDGLYGAGDYGTPRTAYPRIAVFTPTFTVDNWGEDLIVMTSADGRLLRWKPSVPATPLTAVPNAPENNRSFVVTPERYVIIFGQDNKSYEFAWCDQEDIENWNFVSTSSKAGFLPVYPRAPIVSHIKSRNATVIFTNRDIGVIEYVGLPYIYSYRRISEAGTPFSAFSVVETKDTIIWPASDGFWEFNGISIEPLDCTVWDWILKNINEDASKYYAAAVNVSVKSEVWWFFSSQADSIPDRYVIYNYRYNHWSMGKMTRTCGLSYPNDINPIMSDGTKVYLHEKGQVYTGAPENPWAETHNININSGYDKLTIKKLLPELSGITTGIRFSVVKSNNPADESQEVYSTARSVRSNGYVDIRETARDFRMRVEETANSEWSMGQVYMDVKGRGKK